MKGERVLERARVDKKELFARLGYEPHPGQARVHASTAQRRVVACGTRWGKSHAAAMEVVAALLEPRAQAKGWVVAPTLDLAQRVLDHVERVLRDKLAHRLLEAGTRDRRLVVRNLGGGRSEVSAKSADAPTGLLGEALDFLVVDEAARMRDDVWAGFLAPRLIDRDGWALLISTPAGCNWFHGLFRLEDAATETFTGPSLENPHVNAELILAERGRMGAERFRQEYEAEFLGAEMIPCKSCGVPLAAPGPTLLVRSPEDEPRPCTECGRPTRPDGTSFGYLDTLGQIVFAYTLLEPRRLAESTA